MINKAVIKIHHVELGQNLRVRSRGVFFKLRFSLSDFPWKQKKNADAKNIFVGFTYIFACIYFMYLCYVLIFLFLSNVGHAVFNSFH